MSSRRARCQIWFALLLLAGGSGVALGQAGAPSCIIVRPMAGVTVSGVVTIDFDAMGGAAALDVSFEFDPGTGFQPMTTAPGSPLVNPDVISAGAGLRFLWDSLADLPGAARPITLRIHVSDGVGPGARCQVSVVIDNNQAPTCDITNPPAGAQLAGTIVLFFHALDSSSPLTMTFDYDIGAGFLLMTPHATSPLANPAIEPPGIGLQFRWDSPADIGIDTPATLRLTLDDGVNPPVRCTLPIQVNNDAPPACAISAPAAGASASGLVNLIFDAIDTGPAVALDFAYDAGGGFQPMTPSAISPLPNPASPAPGTGLAFQWDSRADLPGAVALPVALRVTVDDGVHPPAVCTTSIVLDNSMLPLCASCGDCTLGGGLPNIIDALSAAQIAAGLLQPTAAQIPCCDVNASGAIEILDGLLIARNAAGLGALLVCP